LERYPAEVRGFELAHFPSNPVYAWVPANLEYWRGMKGGFVEGTPADLPAGRREKYDQSGRNSKVLVKKLK